MLEIWYLYETWYITPFSYHLLFWYISWMRIAQTMNEYSNHFFKCTAYYINFLKNVLTVIYQVTRLLAQFKQGYLCLVLFLFIFLIHWTSNKHKRMFTFRKKLRTPTRYIMHRHFQARKSFMLEYLADLQWWMISRKVFHFSIRFFCLKSPQFYWWNCISYLIFRVVI